MKESSAELPLLRIKDLHVDFDLPSGTVRAVRGISFDLHAGQILGVVGESGSGKSVTSRAIMRMLRNPGRVSAGSIQLEGEELLTRSPVQMQQIRGERIAMIFQDPQAALNPVIRVKHQIMEALQIHGANRRNAEQRAVELLRTVGIPDPENAGEKFPHQFSGGMRQRVVIAIALANEPSVLIADEPTTALDVTIQAQILDLLRSLRDELGIAILFITHDMGVVAEICDDVVVMYCGKIVESGSVRAVLSNPRDPYTVRLMEAIPRMDSPLRLAIKPPTEAAPVLELRNLRTNVNTKRASPFRRLIPFYAVDDVSLRIDEGETLSLVGESGCGKSTLSRTVVGITEPESGEILIDGARRATSGPEKLAQTRAVQYVFQDPYSSLNPRRTAGQSLEEALRCAGCPTKDLHRRSLELLERVGLGAEHLDRYPWAFSGGQRQRIGIARALASDPRLLILDEPVSALDVSIQAQIMELLIKLQEEDAMAYLFISHDLAVVREISHRVAVMFKGRLVEQGSSKDVFGDPQHSYTRALLAATPDIDSAIAG